MIKVKNLVKEFNGFRAVDNISFAVEKGEVLGFLGPNGAGKSTTMRIITCFLQPTSGSAEVNGYDIIKQSVKVRSQIGYLPENTPVYSDMTVNGYLNFIAEMRGLFGKAKSIAVERAIDLCFLKNVRYQSVDTLSKGYRQRACFGQAVLHDPPVLVLDEPTDGLDPNQKYEVRQMIANMSANKVILISTHILEEVEAICNRAIIIANGKIVANGSPTSLKQHSANYGAILLGVKGIEASEAQSKLAKIFNVDKIEQQTSSDECLQFRIIPQGHSRIIDAIAKLAQEERWQISQLSEEQGRLDEVFRDITSNKA